jgi:hypothetical protein
MHARKRGVESFEKFSRERKIKRKVWVWKRKKKERKKKIYIYENERKNIWKRKRERWVSNKDMRGMDQVKEKKNKV